jgi:solute carrier family 44 (choline transporter-like protein), member 2/4/5
MVDTEKHEAHPSYGVNANRGCTDIICLLMFAIFWGILFFLASVVFKQGDPNRIFYGTDKYGNNCGHERKVNLTGLGGDAWESRTNIWYPLQFDPTSTSASVDSSISIGICVRECPKAGTLLYGYSDAAAPSLFPPIYFVLYDSFPVMHRCFPNVSSVICNSMTNCDSIANNQLLAAAPVGSESMPLTAGSGVGADPNSTTTGPNTTTTGPNTTTSNPNTTTSTILPNTTATVIVSSTTSAATTTGVPSSTTSAPPTPSPSVPTSFSIGGLAAFRDMANDSIDELSHNWWVILIGMLIAMLLSFAWLFVLRRTVKPLVILTGLVLLVVLIVGGGLCFMMRQNSLDDVQSDPQTPKYWLAGAIAFWVVSFLFLCVMLFLRKDIMTACDIIEEASKVPIKIPTMACVPVICFLLVIPFVVWAVFVAIYIQSCGDTLTVAMPNVTIPGGGNMSTLFNSTAATIELKQWRIPAHLYNIFMFLWVFGVLNAVCFMIIALCAVFWYFSAPGDDKNPPNSAVFTSVGIVVRNHLGTIFFGAFIVAIIQIIRIILLVVEKKMSDTLKKNDAVKGLMAALHCILACLERAMKFINKNAYIMTAIEGSNFLTSAQRALALLVGNALTVGAITIISEYVMIFGKILITGITTLIVFGILKGQNGSDALRSGVLILACCALVAFFIASLFVNIFSVCIDAILLCYCVDKESSGPHYFPSDLEKHIDKERLKHKVGDDDGMLNKEEPLLALDHNKEVDLL